MPQLKPRFSHPGHRCLLNVLSKINMFMFRDVVFDCMIRNVCSVYRAGTLLDCILRTLPGIPVPGGPPNLARRTLDFCFIFAFLMLRAPGWSSVICLWIPLGTWDLPWASPLGTPARSFSSRPHSIHSTTHPPPCRVPVLSILLFSLVVVRAPRFHMPVSHTHKQAVRVSQMQDGHILRVLVS